MVKSAARQKKRSRVLSHSFYPFPFIPQSASQFLEHHSVEGGATVRKGAGGGWGAGEPQPRGHVEPREHFKAPPAQRFHRFFDAVGLISLREGPPGSRDWGLNLKARGTPGPLWGHIACLILRASSAPQHSTLGTEACSGSRDMIPAQVTMA